MNIDYDEILEIYGVSALLYNELGNGTLKLLPPEIYEKIDRAVSRALVVGILTAKYDIHVITKSDLDTIINELLERLLYNNSHK